MTISKVSNFQKITVFVVMMLILILLAQCDFFEPEVQGICDSFDGQECTINVTSWEGELRLENLKDIEWGDEWVAFARPLSAPYDRDDDDIIGGDSSTGWIAISPDEAVRDATSVLEWDVENEQLITTRMLSDTIQPTQTGYEGVKEAQAEWSQNNIEMGLVVDFVMIKERTYVIVPRFDEALFVSPYILQCDAASECQIENRFAASQADGLLSGDYELVSQDAFSSEFFAELYGLDGLNFAKCNPDNQTCIGGSFPPGDWCGFVRNACLRLACDDTPEQRICGALKCESCLD